MTDLEKTIDVINNFLEDENQKYFFLKGVDDDNKIRVIIHCLNKSKFKKGLVRISKNLNDIPRILKRMGLKDPKSRYKYNEFYKVGSMNIKFDSYTSRHTMKSYNEALDFTVIYPVQSIADRTNEHDWFIEMMKKLNSKKIILVTTNDGIHEFDWIEKEMDAIYSYDSKNDNPELYERVINNTENLKRRIENRY